MTTNHSGRPALAKKVLGVHCSTLVEKGTEEYRKAVGQEDSTVDGGPKTANGGQLDQGVTNGSNVPKHHDHPDMTIEAESTLVQENYNTRIHKMQKVVPWKMPKDPTCKKTLPSLLPTATSEKLWETLWKALEGLEEADFILHQHFT
ncbi:hypothetical protein JCM33374_g6067 [Metschnikowia sp. JCM 33374]|nr:hypothetical protein JCM33374_g6067 [Metschnikowia sp. JCM 33374]